jgi:Shedu protein SduA, C-terminal
MMIEITVKNEIILLKYSPRNGADWIYEDYFKSNEKYWLRKTFHFSQKDQEESRSICYDDITFKIGECEGQYYKIYSKILETQYDVKIHNSIELKKDIFIVDNNISIFKRFEMLANQQIIIGEEENSIPIGVFFDIIKSFPTRTELKHYANSRVTNVLSQYLDRVKDSGKAFERYLEKRNKMPALNTIPSIRKYEYEKYEFILAKLKNMLADSDAFAERDWQAQIMEIILILYPKYIVHFSEVKINDYYSQPGKVNLRRIDIMLLDSNGNVDIIEIKKPFSNCIITKNDHRGNYIPLKELSGTVMQVEKYLFHLNKWGRIGEEHLTKKLCDKLPSSMKIQITNPKGIIIMGREENLSPEQLFDFEIIKRKYSNILDIMTYDDLINRLENIITKFQNA